MMRGKERRERGRLDGNAETEIVHRDQAICSPSDYLAWAAVPKGSWHCQSAAGTDKGQLALAEGSRHRQRTAGTGRGQSSV